MTRVAVTGAAGNVGRRALAALDDHDVTPLTHREHDDLEGDVVDVADLGAFVDALADQDVLVHLAANPSTDAAWDDLRDPNVEGAYNAFEAARENDLDRVVFASSNHAVHMHTEARPAAEGSTTPPDAGAVRPDDPPRPDSHYGVTKVLGEALGSYYADGHGIEAVSLRIGWLLSREQLRDTQDDDEDGARFARGMWLSHEDCERVIRAAVEADLPRPSVIAHAVSANDDRTLSLTETMRALDYRPRDNASLFLEES